ncbi:tail fiber protein [Enterobacteria phage HK225]|uniref:tail fiber protein n=1 Tax=Enterobacteria phage HK225 TaxID=1147144 RepID=UPI00029D2F5A|nr:tail fiber protein [Enterobacteria phage HK225]AFH20337.1 tail fiber [Enterobacteria phage HK225]
MSAGTITLTNGSAVVGGAGTSFATELAGGDFIVSTVGGVPYTLPVKTVDNNTQVTLVSNFTGPTQSGAAWSAVPRVALNMVTAALVAQSAEALRGLNYDKQNWQQVYSAAGNITVKLPDGTTFTGPSWKYLSDNMATKSGGAVPVNQGGTGATTGNAALSNLGITYVRSGTNYSVIKIGDIYQMDFLIGGGIAIGAYNPSVVGGIAYYTHYYKLPLPMALPNGVITAIASISGDRFGNQYPGYNADVKVSRDKDDGSGLLTTYLTVSVKTPQTGWTPYFHIRVVGY